MLYHRDNLEYSIWTRGSTYKYSRVCICDNIGDKKMNEIDYEKTLLLYLSDNNWGSGLPEYFKHIKDVELPLRLCPSLLLC